jgi:hypothetical protein
MNRLHHLATGAPLYQSTPGKKRLALLCRNALTSDAGFVDLAYHAHNHVY